ncbi:MAG: Ig-like domain-containing protein [Bacillota bacterium]
MAGKVTSPAAGNDPTADVLISGVTAGDTIRVYDSDGITVLGTATASGTTVTITTGSLSEGGHNLTVKATDPAGNVSAASARLVLFNTSDITDGYSGYSNIVSVRTRRR